MYIKKQVYVLFMYVIRKGNVLFNDALNTFYLWLYRKGKEMFLFNDALNTFYLWLYGKGKKRKCFYLMMHSTHFIYGYMASDIW